MHDDDHDTDLPIRLRTVRALLEYADQVKRTNEWRSGAWEGLPRGHQRVLLAVTPPERRGLSLPGAPDGDGGEVAARHAANQHFLELMARMAMFSEGGSSVANELARLDDAAAAGAGVNGVAPRRGCSTQDLLGLLCRLAQSAGVSWEECEPSPLDRSKVRSTLRQFVREWSDEGVAERARSVDVLVDALEAALPPPASSDEGEAPRVLVPGAGLGRVVLELAQRGYDAEGNEFSYHMLFGSQLVLNAASGAECWTLFPWIDHLVNVRDVNDPYRPVRVPDVHPSHVMAQPRRPGGRMSMSAGEFVSAYSSNSAGSWDGVATCFFLDTAPNIVMYVELMAHLLRPGGVWVNLGPLQYHWVDGDMDGTATIQLAWSQIRALLDHYGFDVREERSVPGTYVTNAQSMQQVVFHSEFFCAVRRSGSG